MQPHRYLLHRCCTHLALLSIQRLCFAFCLPTCPPLPLGSSVPATCSCPCHSLLSLLLPPVPALSVPAPLPLPISCSLLERIHSMFLAEIEDRSTRVKRETEAVRRFGQKRIAIKR